MDEAVRTAYSSGWKAGIIDSKTDCGGCRLPNYWWVSAHLGLCALWVILFAFSLKPLRNLAGTGNDAMPKHLRRTFRLFVGLALATEGAAMVFRLLADRGHHGGADRVALGADFGALAFLGIFVIVALSAVGRTGAVRKLRIYVQRHRTNLVGLGVLVVIVDLVADTSSQAIDSVRTWLVPDKTHLAHLSFGLAATLVLSLVVYETSLRLARSHAAVTEPVTDRRPVVPSGARWWVATLFVIGLGLVMKLFLSFGLGVCILGGLMGLLGVLEWRWFQPPPPESPSPDAQPCGECPDTDASVPEPGIAPELLAIVPLLTIASAAIAGAIDSMLTDAPQFHFGSFALVFPALFLGFVAVVMTGDGQPAPAPAPLEGRGWLVALLVVALLSLPFWLNTKLGADIAGFALLLIVFGYATALFHGSDSLHQNRNGFVILPVSFLGGLATMFALNTRVFSVSHTLGVFGLVNIALAGILGGLFWLANWAIDRRPPRLLSSIGVQQLPILTLLAVWWLAAGLTAPAQLHDVRLTRLQPPVAPATHNLQDAFHAWLADHNSALEQKADGPVPLVLVATHGGGIRSAYWTAVALDCIVAAHATKEDPEHPDYDKTCRHRRKPDETRAAAKNIFLISSVSGGALGTYAYARELLGEGYLPYNWFQRVLGGDFAAPTIGWGLFHDLPNHFLGLHPGTGGSCSFSPGGECLESDRASVLENSFDRHWRHGRFLRGVWQTRSTVGPGRTALVPLLIFNSTVVGGKARSVTSPVPLSAWPLPETSQLKPNAHSIDQRPLAGTAQALTALCGGSDMRLVTAALLAGRFPYVSPAGRIDEHCRPNADTPRRLNGACGSSKTITGRAGCKLELVDGGYIDNSGLATVDALFASIKQMVEDENASHPDRRKIALVIVELDNYYVASAREAPSADSTVGQTLAPPVTAFGGRNSVETVARADAYRLTPGGCTITVSPARHPGLHAPVGWEISPSAETELRNGLVARRDTDTSPSRQPLFLLKRLQNWLGGTNLAHLVDCVPHD
jgi:hypothetical protein